MERRYVVMKRVVGFSGKVISVNEIHREFKTLENAQNFCEQLKETTFDEGVEFFVEGKMISEMEDE